MNSTLRKYRLAVQGGFFLFIAFLGFRFWQFVQHFETRGKTPFVPHPDGVEGFLPIGGLTSLKYWLVTGDIHPAHPAALFIFLGAVAVSVALKKGFCGWICPVGFLSEHMYKPWQKLFKKNVKPPRWIDYPLRSLKYLIFAFFFWAIIITMDVPGLHNFLDGDYWKVADVKMLKFFTNISPFALQIIVILVLLSIPIRNFWCRYLCPYGALLGIAAVVSPFEITRHDDKCVHCKKCTRNCPAYLAVEEKGKVVSPECTSCMTCLSGCPKSAITYSTPGGGRSLTGWQFPAILIGIFLSVYLVALATGHWHSYVPMEDLKRLVPIAGSLQHP
ncbi:MAG: 4Fe-4S binding protein [Nitrospirae bacterium]|nr:4Fe-4S binding protein [Nitrospirota bacterium]